MTVVPVATAVVVGGASVCALYGMLTVDPPEEPIDCGLPTVGLLGIGAAVGAALGGILGSLSTKDRWARIPLDRLRVSVTPRGRGRMGLGLSVRF